MTEEIVKATGRISAELVTPYPPGTPALAPVKVVNEAIIDYFEGAADQTLRTLRVVR